MDNETLDERKLRIVKRLQNKYNKPDAGCQQALETEKKEHKTSRKGLYTAAFGSLLMTGIAILNTHFNNISRQAHTNQVAALQSQIQQLEQQLNQQNGANEKAIAEWEQKWRQTEDQRYQAQRKLNRTSEQLAKMQGNTREARLMVDKLQEMLGFTLDPKAAK